MDKKQAKQILKNTGYIGNEVGVAFDVAIKSMDKLEKIEQIINETNRRESILVNPEPKITVRSMGFDKIREVLNG